MKVLCLSEQAHAELVQAIEEELHYAARQVSLCELWQRTNGIRFHAHSHWRKERLRYYRLLKAVYLDA